MHRRLNEVAMASIDHSKMRPTVRHRDVVGVARQDNLPRRCVYDLGRHQLLPEGLEATAGWRHTHTGPAMVARGPGHLAQDPPSQQSSHRSLLDPPTLRGALSQGP